MNYDRYRKLVWDRRIAEDFPRRELPQAELPRLGDLPEAQRLRLRSIIEQRKVLPIVLRKDALVGSSEQPHRREQRREQRSGRRDRAVRDVRDLLS